MTASAWSINKRAISVALTNNGGSTTFDNSAHGPAFTFSNIVNGDSVTITYTGTKPSATANTSGANASVDAGGTKTITSTGTSQTYSTGTTLHGTNAGSYSYAIAANAVDNGNYSIAAQSLTYTINQLEISVSFAPSFGANPTGDYSDLANFSLASYYQNDAADTYLAATPVFTSVTNNLWQGMKLIITGATGGGTIGNMTISSYSNVVYTNVTSATVQNEGFRISSAVSPSANSLGTITLANGPAESKHLFSNTAAVASNNARNSGLTVNAGNCGNFKWSATTASWQTYRKEVSQFTYLLDGSGVNSTIYSGTTHTVTATKLIRSISDLRHNDGYATANMTQAVTLSGNTGSNAGSYTATQTYTSGTQYYYSGTFTWTIYPKRLTSSNWSLTTSKVYDKNTNAVIAFNSGALCGSDTLSISAAYTTKGTSSTNIYDVGTGKTITVTIGTSGNYTVGAANTLTTAQTVTGSSDGTITKRPLSVSWKDSDTNDYAPGLSYVYAATGKGVTLHARFYDKIGRKRDLYPRKLPVRDIPQVYGHNFQKISRTQALRSCALAYLERLDENKRDRRGGRHPRSVIFH